MSKILAIILFTSVSLSSLSAQTGETTSAPKFKGFLGTYHPAKRTAYGYKTGVMRVTLRAGQRVSLADVRLKR
jgi:hypothetical protein